MKKLLGAVNTKVVGIASAIVIGGGLLFAFSQGGAPVGSPLGRIQKAIADVNTEFMNTMEDFMPDMGIKEFNEKYAKDNTYSMDLNLTTDMLQSMGINKAGIDISTKYAPKDKKAQFDAKISVGGLVGVDAKLVADGDNAFISIPQVYNKAIKVNMATIGADLQSEEIKKFTDGEDLSELKDLKINIFSDLTNPQQLMKNYTTYTKAELETLIKNSKIDKVDLDLKFSDKLKELGSTKSNLEQFNIAIKSEDYKALLIKSLDFYQSLQTSQISGIDTKVVTEDIERQKKAIQDEDMPETLNFSVVLSGEKLIVFSFDLVEQNAKINAFFAGEKNTTDRILVSVDSDKTTNGLDFTMTTKEDKNEMNATLAEEMQFTSTYTKSSKEYDMKMTFRSASEGLSMKGKYTDVVKGTSYKFDLTEFNILQSGSPVAKFKGTMGISLEKPTIDTISDSVEVLKLKEGELTKLNEDITKNIQQNFAPLLSLVMGGM